MSKLYKNLINARNALLSSPVHTRIIMLNLTYKFSATNRTPHGLPSVAHGICRLSLKIQNPSSRHGSEKTGDA